MNEQNRSVALTALLVGMVFVNTFLPVLPPESPPLRGGSVIPPARPAVTETKP